MKEVNEIRGQIGHLKSKIKEAEGRLELAGLKSLGLEIGDRIIKEGRSRGDLVEVTGCSASFGTPRPTGFRVKKDGTISQSSAGYIGEWRRA